MNLEEFKAHVESQRKISTQNAVIKMISAKDYLTKDDLFDQDDLAID